MGTYLEEYLDSIFLLPSELKRNFELVRELDEDSFTLLEELRGIQKDYLSNAKDKVQALYSRPGSDPTEEELKEVVEDETSLSLLKSTRQRAVQKLDEKVAIASQMYDLVDHHIRRLDTDLANYECLLKQNGEYEEEKSNTPPPILTSSSSKKSTGVLGRKRAAETPFEVSPPIPSLPMDPLPTEEPLIDPNEPVYCSCRRVSYGQMVGCDNDSCKYEWFHYECVGLKAPPAGKWYCADCVSQGFGQAV